MVWAIGHTLRNGEYTIEKELGNGRFLTYLARHKDGSLVVIKILNDRVLQSLSPTEQQRLRETFKQESVKLAKCRNPHVVKVGYPFIEGNRECIVMEYINGRSLVDRNDRVLPEEVALRYIQQVGEALVVVHENDLTHRDVQPKNILLESRSGNDVAVLISFSLAVEQNQKIEVQTQEATEGFAPPELYSRFGGDMGPHTDIYSLAATLYNLLTGIQPQSAIERRTSKTDPLPSPIGYNSKISDRTNQAIMQGLALDPKDRPDSMRDWLASLGLTVNLPPSPSSTSNRTGAGTDLPPLPSDPNRTGGWWNRLSFEDKMKVVGAVIATIAAIGGLLGGLGGLFNSTKPTPSSSPITTPTKTP